MTIASHRTNENETGLVNDFQVAYPTFDLAAVDALRRREYGRLDAQGHIYLDYTGGGLYAESQLREHQALLSSSVFGNPHSTNPTSLFATGLAERARAAVLAYFNADPSEYTVVFTANASGALKLVGEAYPFGPDCHLLLTADNHNSVNGIREFARARGASVTYLPIQAPELRTDQETLEEGLHDAATGGNRLTRLLQHLGRDHQGLPGGQHGQSRQRRQGLFAFPAQSNFSGVQHPLTWIEQAQARGWEVLLDAAAFVPTSRLDLNRWRPDFVSLSFYKLFGYPTGIGALIARRAALARLHRPWYAGGTITISSVWGNGHYLAEGEAGFEDGTINYLGLPAVEIGLRYLERIGIETLQMRTQCLTGWLLAQLVRLQHSNGAPLAQIYGPTTPVGRGGTVALNILAPDGSVVDYRQVEALANARGISLRTGCFCNPGAREAALDWSPAELLPLFKRDQPLTLHDLHRQWPERAIGAVRLSVGLATTPIDLIRCLHVLQELAR